MGYGKIEHFEATKMYINALKRYSLEQYETPNSLGQMLFYILRIRIFYKTDIAFHAKTENYTEIKADVKFDIEDHVKFEVFVPFEDEYFENMLDNSLVYRLRYGEVSLIFMGECTLSMARAIYLYTVSLQNEY